jgi:hypothetical protein
MLGTFIAEKVWVLNPQVDTIDKRSMTCIALVARRGDVSTLVHALQESSLYDPFVLQASATVSINIEDPLTNANETLSRWNMISSQWLWRAVSFNEGMLLDFSGLPLNASDAALKPDPAKISIFQRVDTLQLVVPDTVLPEFSEISTNGRMIGPRTRARAEQ